MLFDNTNQFFLVSKEKNMFGLFKKNPVAKLEAKYKSLLEEAYRLSSTDRTASDEKTAEANEILKEIEKLNGQ